MAHAVKIAIGRGVDLAELPLAELQALNASITACLLYTSDAADERSSVDLGGRRIIKKKNYRPVTVLICYQTQKTQIGMRIIQRPNE